MILRRVLRFTWSLSLCALLRRCPLTNDGSVTSKFGQTVHQHVLVTNLSGYVGHVTIFS